MTRHKVTIQEVARDEITINKAFRHYITRHEVTRHEVIKHEIIRHEVIRRGPLIGSPGGVSMGRPPGSLPGGSPEGSSQGDPLGDLPEGSLQDATPPKTPGRPVMSPPRKEGTPWEHPVGGSPGGIPRHPLGGPSGMSFGGVLWRESGRVPWCGGPSPPTSLLPPSLPPPPILPPSHPPSSPLHPPRLPPRPSPPPRLVTSCLVT